MFTGYRLIGDYTKAIECGRKLLGLLSGCEDRIREGSVTLDLAELCKDQFNYKEAIEFYRKALQIMVEVGNRNVEGLCYGRVYYRGCYSPQTATFCSS